MDFLKFFGKEDVSSKDIAKERLKLVLIHDRANVSPQFLEMIKSMNMWSGKILIDSLSEEALKQKIEKRLEYVINNYK